MVCSYDDKPVPKVIDFGLAKAAGIKLTERTLFTEFGSIVGTLEYMSPEQAKLNQLDIDTRSDIYSLGVLLYELLTGTTPLRKERFQDTAVLEVLRLIREEEPPRPSVRLSTEKGLPSVAANRGLGPSELSGLVRGELDWIVMKALEKDRNRRYETANELALDVERFLQNELVQACPPSAWYRLYKFGRRNRGTVLAAGLLFLALLAGIVGTTAGLLQARDSAEAERLATLEARAKQRLAEDAVAAEEARFALARRLADEMIQIAEEESSEGRGQQERLRRRLLESAVAYYQEFIELRRDNPGSGRIGIDPRPSTGDSGRPDLDPKCVSTLVIDGSCCSRRFETLPRHSHTFGRCARATSVNLSPVRRLAANHHLRVEMIGHGKCCGEMRGHETAIAGILSPAQLRASGANCFAGPGAEALQEPEVVAVLNLSREQRTQLRSICGPRPGRHHGPGRDSESSPTSASEKRAVASREGHRNEPPPWHGPGHHHEAEMQKALALLGPEQLVRWHELTGPPFAGLSEPQHARGHDGPHD